MGSYRRAMDKLTTDIQRSDLDIPEKCRILNDRIMSVSGRGSLSLNLYLIITLPYFDFLLHISAYLLNSFFFFYNLPKLISVSEVRTISVIIITPSLCLCCVSAQVERHFLSPYVSPRDQPYRHILLGNGPHTLTALSEHLEHLRTNDPKADIDLFHEQFSLATWTIQGCANALAGNIWSFEKEI